jgi:hypothetical protein
MFENGMIRLFGTRTQEATGGWRSCTIRNIIILLVTKYQDVQIKDDEMGDGGGGAQRRK